MSTSPARRAANRRNALLSTGPKTDEGKAASRLNAFRHGLAGDGILLAPREDPQLVDKRAKAFASELGAKGEVGELLAHRAALLSVRMERSADREMAVVASNSQAVRDQFNQDRLDEFDGWITDLDDPRTFLIALKALESTPEGVAHLIATWLKFRDEIRSEDESAANLATTRAALWLGLTNQEAKALENRLTGRIAAEIDRLRRVEAESMPHVKRAIDALRDQAAIIARFDPSPDASLARRYEAAAERGMYRAIRAIAEIRRPHQDDLSPILQPAPPIFEGPVNKPLDPPRPISTPLGSFRDETWTAAIARTKPLLDLLESTSVVVEPRKKRPDLRKLALNCR